MTGIMLLAVEVLLVSVTILMLHRYRKVAVFVVLLASCFIGVYLSSFTFKGATITGTSTMRAAVYDVGEKFHGIRLDTNVPVPDHTDSQLLIEVRAAGLNPSNYKIVPAQWPVVRHLRTWVAGYDVAGVVLSIGQDSSCDHLKVSILSAQGGG